MKLWLDDIRPAPEDYTHARSVNEASALLVGDDLTHASLDHDLGDFEPDGGDGYKLVLWMAENDRWSSEGIRVCTQRIRRAWPEGRWPTSTIMGRIRRATASLAGCSPCGRSRVGVEVAYAAVASSF